MTYSYYTVVCKSDFLRWFITVCVSGIVVWLMAVCESGIVTCPMAVCFDIVFISNNHEIFTRYETFVSTLFSGKPEFLTDRKHQNFSINKRNQATRLYFRARTHSLLIADCQMKKLQSASDTTSSFFRERDTFTCSWTGELPDLTLTLVLFHLTPSDNGLWRLELTNELGTGIITFTIVLNGK